MLLLTIDPNNLIAFRPMLLSNLMSIMFVYFNCCLVYHLPNLIVNYHLCFTSMIQSNQSFHLLSFYFSLIRILTLTPLLLNQGLHFLHFNLHTIVITGTLHIQGRDKVNDR